MATKSKSKQLATRGSLQAVGRRMTFDIDPRQGAAGMFGMCALEGHKLVSLKRKGKKVTCYYEPNSPTVSSSATSGGDTK